ncbi:hypothetical protein [Pedobacter sp. MC2016-24]|uniref:hypothetical protein n=1 Tax=Pedobacter sp. MC2016-24 TaxID=2780090 RepID=UPI00187F919F|nr:hypothetical protein [Pedobacter sp. MC2016-24]MBE9601574.1 hypothetical protein [Pedobacter sp. MC2016-24]
MRNILIYLRYIGIGVIFLSACTKQSVIDSGVSNGIHQGSMMAYFKTDSYNWDSTIVIIKRANLETLFSGKDNAHPQITFWGPTNHSIRRYMLVNNINSIQDIPVDLCREMILKHVLDKRFLKNEFAFRNPSYSISDPRGGGTEFNCLAGNQLRAYKEQYNDPAAPNVGPIYLRLYSVTSQIDVPVASADIQTDNGVVMSLGYDYLLGNI